MKINPSVGFEHYKSAVQSYKSGDTSAVRLQDELRAAVAEPKNTDKVTISESAASRAEIGRITGAISAQIESAGSMDRIAELRAAVQNGTYSVPAADVAAAILGNLT